MASGDPMGVLRVVPAGADSATRDWRVSGTTPSYPEPVYDFPENAIKYIYLRGRLARGYGGGGVTLYGSVMSTSATAGDVVIEAGIRRLDTGEDIDASHSYSRQSATVSVSGTSGAKTYWSIAFTSGAQMDSLALGEGAVIQIRRNRDSGSDTLVGDAELAVGDFEWYET
jgi:hypothetical protein